ncbi:hypothetical protein DL93DRAFT_2061512 [Clavulina sp. PMI_390]|nr:hypothetical protein DL93DRAFT_2061512 [Clavulina sp. PMI_390]
MTVHTLCSFFQHGYADGYAHGRIHGLIEGRAAGKEKGLELWEEVGYYRGFALFWKSVHANDPSSRVYHHITSIMTAIDQFPLVNPKPQPATETESEGADEQLDVSKLLTQIRSRHKVLCSALGVPAPRLRALATGEYTLADGELVNLQTSSTKGKASVWKIDNENANRPALEL